MADFVLAGGHVVDPAQGVDAPMDVIVRDGQIAAVVAPGSPQSTAPAPPTIQVPGSTSPSRSVSARPTFPATGAWSMTPSSSQVVVLPLVPVTPRSRGRSSR